MVKPAKASDPPQHSLSILFRGPYTRVGSFVRVPTDALTPKIEVGAPPVVPPLALYRQDAKTKQFVRFREAGQPVSPLALSNEPEIWIEEKDLAPLRHALEPVALRPGAPPEVLRATALSVMEDLYAAPTPENLKRSTRVVSSFVHSIMKDSSAFLLISKLGKHDPYTLSHSVGTAVNAIILAKRAGVTSDDELAAVGLAGLLHDIGKTRVPAALINKTGKLTGDEWEEMKRHAQHGHDIVKELDFIPESTKAAILDHHEDRHQGGYPRAKPYAEVGLFARIVTLADMYNALTTDRSYSKARTPFEAFDLMRTQAAHKIDPELFELLVKIYGGAP